MSINLEISTMYHHVVHVKTFSDIVTIDHGYKRTFTNTADRNSSTYRSI